MTEYKPYKPQYKERNLTPLVYPARQVPPNTDPAPFVMAFSSKRRETQSAIPPVSNVPYAEPGNAVSQHLNVGNNIDNTWSAVESIPSDVFGIVEEGTQFDPNQPMIDNNFEVEMASPVQAPRYIAPRVASIDPNPRPGSLPRTAAPMRPPLRVEEAPVPVPVSAPTLPDVGEYVLLLAGEVVSIGDSKQIQDAAWSFLTESESLPDDIIVMKRVAMNIGVFLSE